MDKPPTKPGFSGRRKARRLVMQALYAWLISENNISDIEKYFLIANANEKLDIEYFRRLIHSVPQEVSSVDALIAPHIDRKVNEVSPIELSILRLAVYELKYDLSVPYKVVINEALELAKTFGATDSFKFVNGVLDKVAKIVRQNG
jgi:transcription antitermination protein NusB